MYKISLLLLLSAFTLISGCKEQKQISSEEPSLVVAPALVKELTITRNIVGQARAYESVEIIPRINGFLINRNFTEGQFVKKGDLLYEIEKINYQALYDYAQGEYLQKKALLDNAEAEYNRNKTLIDKNAVSVREYEAALYAYESAKGALLQSQASLTEAKSNLAYTSILAPFDGKVGMTYVSVGNYVAAEQTKLAILVSTDPMRIQFNLSETDISGLIPKGSSFQEEAKKITVTLQFQDGTVYDQAGELYFIDNRINTSTGTILVEALFKNENKRLIPGAYVNVMLRSSEPSKNIVIPQCAIVQMLDGDSVYVMNKDGSVSMKKVETGQQTAPYVEIKSGLTEGELVVTQGIQNITAGMKFTYTYDETYAADSERVNFSEINQGTQKVNSKE